MTWAVGLLLAIWGGYAAFGQRWRIAPQLPSDAALATMPRVVAVVPARNEAGELPETLPSLFAQSHGQLTVVLVDDHSTDGTAEVARRLAAASHADERLVVISSPELPPGWTGKVWAQQQGFEHARQLNADWVWFTDADIRHAPDVLARLLSTADRQQRDFVSIMARLRCRTMFEKLLIPAFTYFFAGLYPFQHIGDDRSGEAGAAGGCMLVRTSLLDRIGGMAAIREAVIDDVALGRACKRIGGRLWLGYHSGVNSTRGYDTLAGIWTMVARSAYTQLRYNPLVLAGCVVGLAYVFVVPLLAIGYGSLMAKLLGLLTYAAMVRTYRPMVIYLGNHPIWALLLPISAVLYTGMTISSAWRHYAGGGAAWKGRTYGAPT